MIIAVNIGNSNIRLGVWSNGNWINSFTIATKPIRSAYEYNEIIFSLLDSSKVESQCFQHIFMASVVPQLTRTIQKSLFHRFSIKPVIVGTDSKTSMTMNGQKPRKELGSDLLANMVAAFETYGKASIIIDFGTALTFSTVDEQGDIKGVVISPGMKASLRSLIENTAQLPEIEIKTPRFVLGNNTVECIQSGVVFGYQSMVEGMIQKINEERKMDHFVIATGGLCHILKGLTDKIHVYNKLHTLEGVRLIGIKNLL